MKTLSFFFYFNLFLSHFFLFFLSHFFFVLHFCLLSHFEINRCIVKSLIFNFNASVWSSKPVYWSPKWTEQITGIYDQITMFHVNLTPKTLKLLSLSNLISLFYVKIRVVCSWPLTLAKGVSTKAFQPAQQIFPVKEGGALS